MSQTDTCQCPSEYLLAQALSLAFLMAAKASASDAPSGTPKQGSRIVKIVIWRQLRPEARPVSWQAAMLVSDCV